MPNKRTLHVCIHEPSRTFNLRWLGPAWLYPQHAPVDVEFCYHGDAESIQQHPLIRSLLFLHLHAAAPQEPRFWDFSLFLSTLAALSARPLNRAKLSRRRGVWAEAPLPVRTIALKGVNGSTASGYKVGFMSTCDVLCTPL